MLPKRGCIIAKQLLNQSKRCRVVENAVRLPELWQTENLATTPDLPVRCSCSCSIAASQSMKPIVAPQPGTVQEYSHHVMLRLPAPKEKHAETRDGIWWPPLMEKDPALLQAFAAVASNKDSIDGVVKVTAYEELPARTGLKQGAADLLIFPEGIQYQYLAVSKIRDVVSHHVVNPTADVPQPSLPFLDQKVVVREFKGVGLFVCTHMQRDSRCGILGVELAEELQRLIEEQELDRIKVYQVSHIGGHKYAGNVVVYGGMSPADGDWFGNVTKDNAAEFLKAVIEVEIGMEGGAESPGLRQFWRGRMGLSKEQQVQLFEDPKARLFSEEEDESDIDLDMDEVRPAEVTSESSSSSSDSSSSEDDTPREQ